jgi:hypothetical protein
VGRRYGFGLFNPVYILILAPSALRMPLTYSTVARPSSGLWLAIRLASVAVGLGPLGMLAALFKLRPRSAGWSYCLAVDGIIPFCVQTAVLDAVVWLAFFSI